MTLTGQSLLSGAISGRQVVCGIAGSAAAAALPHAAIRSNAATVAAIPLVTPAVPNRGSVIKGRPSPRLLRRALASLGLRWRLLEQVFVFFGRKLVLRFVS